MTFDWQKHRLALAIITMMAGALFFLNPSEHGFFPQCLFHRLTGWNCPGCGATRATHELLRGHWSRAFRDNALLVASLPALAGLGVWKWRHPERKLIVKPLMLWILLAVVAGFGVVRNLPGYEWLSP